MKRYAVIGRYENGETYRIGYYETKAEVYSTIEDCMYNEEIDLATFEIVTAEEAKEYENYF